MFICAAACARLAAFDASECGFSPDASGKDNTAALQRTFDRGGTVTVDRPGRYKIADTVFIGDECTVTRLRERTGGAIGPARPDSYDRLYKALTADGVGFSFVNLWGGYEIPPTPEGKDCLKRFLARPKVLTFHDGIDLTNPNYP